MMAEQKKSVIFFVTNLDSGGLENYLLRFLLVSHTRFNDIIIVCKGGRGGSLESRFTEIKNLKIEFRKIGNFHPQHYIALVGWLIKHKNYSICDLTGNFSGPVLLISKIIGIKKRIAFYRSSSNRFSESFFKLKVNSLYNKLVYDNATDILSNSKYAIEFFFSNKKVDHRFKVIHNGIDSKIFLEVKEDLREDFNIKKTDFVIGHTGRFNPAKNHKVIIEVAKELLKKHPNVKFFLCGKGVEKNLKLEAEKTGVSDRIILTENRDDISKVLNTLDAFFFPSITEGQPNSLIEAWIKGIPFVASNIRPIHDITPEMFQKYLFNPLDAESFKLALEDIIVGKRDDENFYISTWARKEFDSEIRFSEFYEVISK